MKLLKGFSLAEVLITLTLIGVIAAITMPTLTSNVVKQQTGPTLAKAINTLENAAMRAMQEGGVRKLSDLQPRNADGEIKAIAEVILSRILAPYIDMSKLSISKSYKNYNMSSYTTIDAKKMNRFLLPDGMDFFSTSDKPTSIVKDSETSKALDAYFVFVDINTNKKGPNILGKDLFVLLVSDRGEVIPYGGKQYAYYTYTPSTTSQADSGCVKGNMSDPKYCAGTIVDNGFRVTYY